MSWRFTRRARRDLRELLAYTVDRFGERQAGAYAALVDQTLEALTASPRRAGSRARGELGEGVLSFHLSLRAARRRGGRHVLFYRSEKAGIVVLRLLHERQDPERQTFEDDP